MRKKLSAVIASIMLIISVLSPLSAYAQTTSLEDMMAQDITAEWDSFEKSSSGSFKASKTYKIDSKKY